MVCAAPLQKTGYGPVYDYHLAFLGRGIFVELQRRHMPLQIADNQEDMKSIVIGQLSSDENALLDRVILKGLGVGRRS